MCLDFLITHFIIYWHASMLQLLKFLYFMEHDLITNKPDSLFSSQIEQLTIGGKSLSIDPCLKCCHVVKYKHIQYRY